MNERLGIAKDSGGKRLGELFSEVSKMKKRIRVLIAKVGLDGHDRGSKVVARALRDAGMEVIYTGLRQTPQQIAEAAIEEDVQVVGVSILSGAHMQLIPPIVEMLRERGGGDILVIAGGIIPDEDAEYLRAAGVAEVFGPGTPTSVIAEYIWSNVNSSQPQIRIDNSQ